MSDDYSVTMVDASTARLEGVMRLGSPQSYEAIFEPIRTAIASAPGRCTIDLSRVVFMNSSGIRSLATLVLAAKNAGRPLAIIARANVPWQKKTSSSLQGLYREVVIELLD